MIQYGMDLARPRIDTTLSWIPLAILVVLLAASVVLGRGTLASPADATTVNVTGSITTSVFLDASGCTPTAVAIGELVPGTDPWKTAQDTGGQACTLSFGTAGHAPGTTLSMFEDPGAPVAPTAAMKCVSGGCAGHALNDYGNPSSEPVAGTSAFGAQLLGASGAANRIWNLSPAVYAVSNAPSDACATPGIGTGGCSFTFGASANASDPPGAYQAQARALVIGN